MKIYQTYTDRGFLITLLSLLVIGSLIMMQINLKYLKNLKNNFKYMCFPFIEMLNQLLKM